MSIEEVVSKSDVQDAVRECTVPIRPTAGGTKQKTDRASESNTRMVDMSHYRGIVAYEASEYLISAKAGTPLSDLQLALAEHGQYLPFDPLLVDEGATLGGTIASGLSGPCRLLYGGLRDFVMEVEFIDGLGQAVRGGGKVVKNAAGFDFPKLMVGSAGRLGILTEATLKVFPQPAASATVRIQVKSPESCQQIGQALLALPLPIAALDFVSISDQHWEVQVRFCGPAGSLPQVVQRSRQAAEKVSMRNLAENDWSELVDLGAEIEFWKGQAKRLDSDWIRVPLAAQDFIGFSTSLATDSAFSKHEYWCGGTGAWLQRAPGVDWPAIDAGLQSLGCAGQRFQWPCGENPYLGNRQWQTAATRVQKALDPHGKFESFQ